jgi:polysaccharide biosynthesis protein VpsM
LSAKLILLDNKGFFVKNIKEIMKKTLLAILLFSLSLPAIAYSARISGHKAVMPAAKSNGQSNRPEYLQRGAFRDKENAEDLSRTLRREGYKVFIVKGVTSHKKRVYRVLASKKVERTVKAPGLNKVKTVAASMAVGGNEDPSLKPGVATEYASVKSDQVRGPLPAGRAPTADVSSGGSQLPEGAFLVSEAGENGLPGTQQQEEGPVGTLRTYREIFGRGGSYFHPSLAVTEIYTDNAFATKDNKKTNLSTVLTPEIWLSLPRVAEKHLVLDETSNRMPGGLVFANYAPEVIRRYQAYLLYRADIPLPSANSPYSNAITHTGYGRFEYNGNKFSANVFDLFVKSFETRGLSVSTEPGQVDKFYNNLFEAAAHVDTGNRLSVRLDYSNFLVHYNDLRNQFMDRTDNSFSGYLFYKLQPKTAAFLEYRFIDISYVNDSSLNSGEHQFLAGVQWDITAKSKGMVKAGYGVKDFTGPSQSVNTFIAEAQIKHQFTPKTSLTVTGFRKTDETNVATFLYTITNQIGVEYQQLFTSKITGLADLMYINERYKDALTTVNTSDIKDNIYQATVGLQYEFQKWLKSDIGYVYTRRDSSFSDYNFVSNTAFLRITGSL